MSERPVLEVSGLTVKYGHGRRSVTAVSDVSFSIPAGRTVGLVGESGSGKSTIGRAILGLAPVSGGKITFNGIDVTAPEHQRNRRSKGQIRAVFQDPYSSLNPSLPIAVSVAEEVAGGRRSRKETLKRISDLFERVGLPATAAASYPGRLSGGQRQRVAIARALVSDPRLIICDEPVSSLDVSVQAQVLNLLRSEQEIRGLSYCFVGHDLDIVRYMSDWIVVLYRGRVLEDGPSAEVTRHPRHPYTQSLVAATPSPDLNVVSAPPLASTIVGANTAAAVGCPFAPRCPLATDICVSELPPVHTAPDGGRVACHRYDPVTDTTAGQAVGTLASGAPRGGIPSAENALR
jgi:peptide/nickel transport system ATP-binding protein